MGNVQTNQHARCTEGEILHCLNLGWAMVCYVHLIYQWYVTHTHAPHLSICHGLSATPVISNVYFSHETMTEAEGFYAGDGNLKTAIRSTWLKKGTTSTLKQPALYHVRTEQLIHQFATVCLPHL